LINSLKARLARRLLRLLAALALKCAKRWASKWLIPKCLEKQEPFFLIYSGAEVAKTWFSLTPHKSDINYNKIVMEVVFAKCLPKQLQLYQRSRFTGQE
jgi:hypothetical protein